MYKIPKHHYQKRISDINIEEYELKHIKRYIKPLILAMNLKTS